MSDCTLQFQTSGCAHVLRITPLIISPLDTLLSGRSFISLLLALMVSAKHGAFAFVQNSPFDLCLVKSRPHCEQTDLSQN